MSNLGLAKDMIANGVSLFIDNQGAVDWSPTCLVSKKLPHLNIIENAIRDTRYSGVVNIMHHVSPGTQTLPTNSPKNINMLSPLYNWPSSSYAQVIKQLSEWKFWLPRIQGGVRWNPESHIHHQY
jgi:hypothetical protein